MKASLQDQRLFSVDDANRMLPLIKRIVSDIVSLSEKLDERQFRLDVIDRQGEPPEYEALEFEEWDLMQQEIDADEDRLEEYVAELVELGVELQDAGLGEVDFPTRIGGNEAYLCWRLGEPEVAYWHSDDSGFDERQLLLGETVSSDTQSPPTPTDN